MLPRVLGRRLGSSAHAMILYGLLHVKKPEPETRLVSRLLDPGQVAIDIGANGADWTRVLSRAVGPAGRVLAFEADPYVAEVTRKVMSLSRLGNAELLAVGLSDRTERTRLLCMDEDGRRVAGVGRIVAENDAVADRTVAVTLHRLDDLAGEHPEVRRARLIKCDVEGYELMVFRGAEAVLREARPAVIAEVGQAALHGHRDRELFDLFADLQYAAFVLDTEGALVALSEGNNAHTHNGNVVFLPNEHPLSADLGRTAGPGSCSPGSSCLT